MTETLREKVIALDKDKIKLPSGLELKEDPQATLAVEKKEDMHYVTLSSLALGIRENLCRGGTNKDYAEAQFNLNLGILERKEYEISCNLNFRPTSFSSSIHEEKI